MAAAEIRPDWTVGTLNLTSGSTAFTTTGSMLQTAAIQAGDEIITAAGLVLVIATITGQNAGTLMEPCPAGAAGTGQPLRIRFQPDGSRYNGATADLVQLLGSGNVYEFAGLEGVPDGVPVFTGSGTMEIQGKDTFVTPDPNGNLAELSGLASVDNLAELSGWTSDQVSDAATAVSYGAQTLTEAQQVQARQNIQADKSYDSIASVAAATVPTFANAIRTNGYYAAGDGGGALYKRVSTEPTHAGKIQSSDGAWWELSVDEPVPVKVFGAKVDGVTNDSPYITGAINSNLPVFLDSGTSAISSTVTLDNTVYTGDVDPSAPANRGRVLKGLGVRRSALVSTVASGVAVDVIYDVGTKAHTQDSFGEFSLTGYSASDGIKIKNAAFLNWEETYIAGFNAGLTLESVLSSKFEDMRISWCQYGISAIKGTGFSQPNALTFQQCVFSNNSVVGYSGGTAHANVSFIGGSFEGNGTHATNGTGGCFINFDGGSQGSVGANLFGVYFEGNGGDADLVLNNTGADYITVNLIGCNFNRVGTTKFVTTNIQAIGKIVVNLIGCTFKGYGGYVEDALRPYITKGSEVRLNIIGCDIPDNVASAGLNAYGGKGRYRGAVASTGSARQLPKGWTSSRDSAGVYTVTHNLNTATLYDYSVSPMSSTPGVSVERVVKGGNIFQVVAVNTSGAQTDADFEFILDHG